MNPEAAAELIWHFAGYLHLTEDYAASRLKYEFSAYQDGTFGYQAQEFAEAMPVVTVPELGSYKIHTNYTPKYDSIGSASGIKHEGALQHLTVNSPSMVHPTVEFDEVDIEKIQGSFSSLPQTIYQHTEIIHTIVNTIVRGGARPPDPDNETPTEGREPTYVMEYGEGSGDKIADIVQQNIAKDKDLFSDGGAEYASLHHIHTGTTIPEMIEAAGEFIPDLGLAAGEVREFWASKVGEHDEAMASGDRTGNVLAPGRYVNGELHEQDPAQAPGPEVEAPQLPQQAEGGMDPGQVAELGANSQKNLAVIADINEAPSTLVVMGDYYQTNAIYQANVLQNRDHVADAGTSPATLDGGANHLDNIATLAVQELAKQAGTQGAAGDLQVNVDVFEGDFFDIKMLTQRNYYEDGDVTVQTQHESYTQVATGENEQLNFTSFKDWVSQYDVIIVLGDYHSANIISQTNILLDDDVVGAGGGSSSGGDGGTIYTGQNGLTNEAAITKYGATTFEGINGDLQEMIAALGNHETVGRDAWSSLSGEVSGSLNVLFVTGSYYDLNVISQINVIADADLAVQIGNGSGLQWLSTGGNAITNMAEIIDTGATGTQYLGGTLYEDSMLVQANLVSDEVQTVQTDPTALVSELVAFIDHAPETLPQEGETWTSNTYSNHDTFGHVLT